MKWRYEGEVGCTERMIFPAVDRWIYFLMRREMILPPQ